MGMMDQYWYAMGLAMLPAVGNFCGGLVAEFLHLPAKVLSFALHFAAGIIVAVVGIELMGTALQASQPWIIALAFVAGGAAAILLDKAIDVVKSRFGKRAGRGGPWMIYAGVAVDLFSDGIMIGTGVTLSSSLALLLALGQVSADIPEGFAIIATFKKQSLSRTQRLLIAASFALPILIGTTVGYWAVRDAPEIYKFALLSFTAGILTTVAMEEIMSHAHEESEEEESGWQTLGLSLGFSLFILLSAYLE
jgi:ZIP family zinc transporter